MIELFIKNKKVVYLAAGIILIIIILSVILKSFFWLLVFYICYLGFFIGFSLFGLKQLSTYGYTGDFCRPIIWIYSIISSTIIIASIVLLILFS